MDVQTYIQHAPKEVSGVAKEWIDVFLAQLPKESRICEIGSGAGRDADYIESHGYTVTRTEKEPGFIDHQRSLGKEISLFDILHDQLEIEDYDAMFAAAVFLHFTEEEFREIFQKIHAALRAGGKLAFSVKEGDNTGIDLSHKKEGYFRYWDHMEIENVVQKAGFSIAFSKLDISSDWIYLICEKI